MITRVRCSTTKASATRSPVCFKRSAKAVSSHRTLTLPVEMAYPPLEKDSKLLKNLGLFSSVSFSELTPCLQLLHMREFEIVMWSCFSKKDKIKELVSEQWQQPTDVVSKHILNHLVNTAYYIK